MKKILTAVLSVVAMVALLLPVEKAESKAVEMRGAWITTVFNLDWPSTKDNVAKQKAEFTTLLDELKSVGINTVIVQVRPKGDALYSSRINPWSEVLTGTQGKNPGYDPLAFMIEETHERGMELHAWFNPYRVTTKGTSLSSLANNHPAKVNPSWAITYEDALYYDPGNPAVRKHIVDTVKEVVSNYNVDGIHFDDYFYPSRDFNDGISYKKYGGGKDIHQWRRENINTMLKEVKNTIKSVKSNVVFGVSPAGIWQNKSSDSRGSNTNGNESYHNGYADTVTWIKRGLVDYVTPQVYWEIGNSAADYATLVAWWAQQVKGTNVDLYIGQAVYKEKVAPQLGTQIELNRKYPEIKGSMLYRAANIKGNESVKSQLKKAFLNNIAKGKLIGADRYSTSTAVSREGWASGAETVYLVNGYANADGITVTPLAAANNAPILLTEKQTLAASTKSELQRLKPSKVVLVGGQGVISNSIEKQIKEINGNIVVQRIGGVNRYETSLLIAKELDKTQDVSKAYVVYGYGEPDALSIASKAGSERTPIILSEKSNITTSSLEWLRGETLQTAYLIGGPGILQDNVLNEVNSITSEDISGNRVHGADRYATNAEVIKRFYTNENQATVIATKGYELADALTAGPFAAKLNSPIVIVNSNLSANQKGILGSKKGTKIYEIGGGINQQAIKELVEVLY